MRSFNARFIVLCMCILLFGFKGNASTSEQVRAEIQPALIPKPVKMTMASGQFTIIPATKVLYSKGDPRLADAAEQDPQHYVGVRRCADRRADIPAHPLLVDDDRGGQPAQHIDFGPIQRRHEAPHEGRIGLVDQPLGLRRDGAEDQRRLARTRDTGEDGQPPLGDLDADVLEVVDPGALDADLVVTVCCVWAGGGHVWDVGIEGEGP